MSAATSISRALNINDDGRAQVLAKLHPKIVVEVRNIDDVEELAVDLNYQLGIRAGDRFIDSNLLITKDMIDYTIDRLDAFREDGRSGIEGTLHRFAVIRDRHDVIVGITVRFGRPVPGVAESLRPYLSNLTGLLVIGPPGVGKTTLLRDIVRITAQKYRQKVVVVDTSNEIGGDGRIPHPIIKPARRIQVPSPERQAEMIRQGIANHGPEVIVVDEIGYHGDVQVVETSSRRGVRVIATCHGETLADVVNNPTFWPLMGGFIQRDDGSRTRITKPTFGNAVEVHGKGKMVVHKDLALSIDSMLEGDFIPDEQLQYIGM